MPIAARLADITTLDVDAVVNAANERLAEGGGVCGAIFRAAGARELAAACAPLAPCPTGEARITPGFGLKARWIIHAVGPRWLGGHRDEAALLAGAYRAALDRLREAGGRSIAFPAISTGIYGYPAEVATRIAVATLRQAAEDLDITVACFDAAMLALYQKELAA
ncbi:macro domain-containing protein [Falsiroseomonas oryzae]|uniref:macro domain-containing protein n=1 Tax=Falsiroseomonas oryzae TaxID=2766473 RepID=UPI0022EAF0D0|nr:macro domain-containing protein [Roseomonas sp. MO-31]